MNGELKGSVIAELEGKGNVKVEYDLTLLSSPSSVYSQELGRLACQLVVVGYDDITEDESAEAVSGFPYTQTALKKVLDEMSFDKMEIQPKAERDEESYYFAARDITLDSGEYNLIVAGFIGSYKRTWFSNFDPLGVARVCNDGAGYAGNDEAGVIHLGFADARDYSLAKLADFVKRADNGKPVKLFITGHSRGAATSNLVGARILDDGGIGGVSIDADNLYVFGFATPNYANVRETDVNNKKYERIFNLVSPEDFVTEVFPKDCGFWKYGTVYSFFGQDNVSRESYAREKEEMTKFFAEYRVERPYVSYKNGNDSVQKIIAVMAKGIPDIDAFYNKQYKLLFKPCTAYEYFRDTICTIVGGNDSPEDQANIDNATQLMIKSAVDGVGTSRLFRKLSEFFVTKQGLGNVTGGKIGAEYFNDAHISETYLAYMMIFRKDQLVRVNGPVVRDADDR